MMNSAYSPRHLITSKGHPANRIRHTANQPYGGASSNARLRKNGLNRPKRRSLPARKPKPKNMTQSATRILAIMVTMATLFFGSCTKMDQGSLNGTHAIDPSVGKANSSYKMRAALINTFAGNGSFGYSGDGGPATEAMLNGPQNICIDNRGNAYVIDLGNAVIRKVDTRTGRILTVAGNGTMGFSGDEGPATSASFAYPFHATTDEVGNLYISDLANNRIRKVDARTGIIHTIAGTGIKGFDGDGKAALATNITEPFGITIDRSGNLIFVDEDGLRLRKLNTRTGIITTIAGSSARGFAGDGGPASQALFDFIWNIAVDKQSGDIYVTDANNHRVRRIDNRTGIITSFAGNGIDGNSGLEGPATQASLSKPTAVAVDATGNVFIADEALSQVYMVEKRSGILHRIAGLGYNGFSGDGGLAIQALLSHPNSLSLDERGQLYICDAFNNRIRKIYNQEE
jgi:DNA-binding beta-propeller fold protein YncE